MSLRRLAFADMDEAACVHRASFERHGFVLTRETDGSRNEEKEPDVLYIWTRA